MPPFNMTCQRLLLLQQQTVALPRSSCLTRGQLLKDMSTPSRRTRLRSANRPSMAWARGSGGGMTGCGLCAPCQAAG